MLQLAKQLLIGPRRSRLLWLWETQQSFNVPDNRFIDNVDDFSVNVATIWTYIIYSSFLMKEQIVNTNFVMVGPRICLFSEMVEYVGVWCF